MAGWGELIAAFAVFFLSHSLPVRPPVKDRLVGILGRAGFTLAYSALSIIVLVWLIIAAGRAPYVEVWGWTPWLSWLTLVLMLVATALVSLAIARPNPLSFGGARNENFDPAKPGIVGWTRHPLLAALMIWSLAHILPNGNVAHIVLFGTFAAFSLFGMKMIDRRKRRILGDDAWRGLIYTKRNVVPTANGFLRLAIGFGVFVALIALHGAVIGVAPLPVPVFN